LLAREVVATALWAVLTIVQAGTARRAVATGTSTITIGNADGFEKG
jgi:hypothetical protein